MKVFKFGGASINNVERIQQLGTIITSYKKEKSLIVISAMGKTNQCIGKSSRTIFCRTKRRSTAFVSTNKRSSFGHVEIFGDSKLVESRRSIKRFFLQRLNGYCMINRCEIMIIIMISLFVVESY